MGRGNHSRLHYVHGCAQAAFASEGSVAPYLAGAGYGLCEVQGEQGLGGEEQDGWLVGGGWSRRGGVLNVCFPRLITLNGMKASEEITEEQSRQARPSFPSWANPVD
jgi:hypothetical protein